MSPTAARAWTIVVSCVLLLPLTACSNKTGVGSSPELAQARMATNPAPQSAFLAYEHEVQIEIRADEMAPRLQALQADCQQAKFGACTVLGVSQSGGDYPRANLKVRIAPAGVEPMIRSAGEGAKIGSRSTHAEDLAEVVADNRLQRSRLQKEHARLTEFQQRKDISVSDMIALSRQLSEIEAQAEGAERAGAQQQRRIDTQLLTVELATPGGQQGRSEIAQSVRDFGAILTTSIAWLIRATAALLPVAALLALLVFVWRRWRRRKLSR
jgi:hypothetical protein